jgi:hypothetical protein
MPIPQRLCLAVIVTFVVEATALAQPAGLSALEARLRAAESAFNNLKPELERAQSAWEKSDARFAQVDWTISRGLVVQRRLAGANRFDGRRAVEVDLEHEDVARFGSPDPFTLSAWIRPTAADGAIITRAEEAAEDAGYGLCLKNGRLEANLVKRWVDDALRVETERALDLDQWRHVAMTYDGSRAAAGIRIYIDGEPQKLKINLDHLQQSFETEAPLRIGAGGGPDNRFRGQIRDVRIYKVALAPDEAAVLATASPVSAIAQTPAEKRTRAERDKIRLYFLERNAPAQIRDAWQRVVDLRERCLIESLGSRPPGG